MGTSVPTDEGVKHVTWVLASDTDGEVHGRLFTNTCKSERVEQKAELDELRKITIVAGETRKAL